MKTKMDPKTFELIKAHTEEIAQKTGKQNYDRIPEIVYTQPSSSRSLTINNKLYMLFKASEPFVLSTENGTSYGSKDDYLGVAQDRELIIISKEFAESI